MEPSNRNCVVLVVEDEPLLRELSAYELQDAGYQVLEAAGADEALDILNSGRDVALMFTDVNMPGSIDGLELARRCHRRWPHMALVVTSGAGRIQPQDVPGEGRFLAKPYLLSELSRVVDRLVTAAEPAPLY
jgi:CheY-like chemotaxis protein